MPFYTYQCDHCGVRFERQQKFTDRPLVCCPECGKNTLRRVYTPVGVVFKGSGFYVTDNRSSRSSSRMPSSKAQEEPTEKKESSPSSESSKTSDSKKED